MPTTKENDLIEFQLKNGATLLIEGINENKDNRKRRGSDKQELIAKAEKTLFEAIDTAKSAAEVVLDSFKEMNSPDEIELQFGIKMAAKAGVVIAAVSSEANFQVTLKWSKK